MQSEVLNELEEDGEQGPLRAGLVPKMHSGVGDRVSHLASK